MSAMTDALSTGLSTAGTNIMTAMGSVIPAALMVLGAYMVIRMAIKTFRTGMR